MHDDVGIERKGLLQDRRQERVVDHGQRSDRMRRFDHMTDVGDAQQRIRRRFDPDQLRLFGKRRGQRQRIVEIDEGDAVEAALGLRVEQAPGAAIAVVRGDQQVSRFEQGRNQGHGGHAGRGDYPALPAFEFGKGPCQRVAGRIAGARIVILTLDPESGEAEVARQIEWRHHRAVGLVAIDTGANGRGGKV